ncbi:MAG: VWA domain-containing protein, partial [Kofleriaceae bacterium]|nr:VWA domain-containing protein [Kofleriaceae bacterium]
GPLDKAKQVVCMMLDSLADHDRFELIEFSNEPHRYSPEPITATAKAKQKAINWVRSRQADGGTEMRAAVVEGLASLRVGAQRQVVVVTDGYVGGEQQIIEAINRRLPKSCRVHVLGLGSAVNRSLATAIARAGKGAEVIVGIDEDAERGAKRLLDRTSMPMLTNVEISGSALLRHAPERIPDVFEGAPLVAALAVKPEGGELVVRGQTARETWTQTITVPAQRSGAGNAAIVALYGRERVADVEANSVFATSDGEIEELGLTFQIATKMTSWVAIDEARKVTGPTRDQLVPQELPYGTRAEAFGLRGSHDRGARTQSGMIRSPELEALRAQLGRGASFDDIGESGPPESDFEDDSSIAPRSFSAEVKKEYDFAKEEATGQDARFADLDLDESADFAAMDRLESPPPAQAFGGRGRAASPTIPEPMQEEENFEGSADKGGESRTLMGLPRPVAKPPADQTRAPRATESAPLPPAPGQPRAPRPMESAPMPEPLPPDELFAAAPAQPKAAQPVANEKADDDLAITQRRARTVDGPAEVTAKRKARAVEPTDVSKSEARAEEQDDATTTRRTRAGKAPSRSTADGMLSLDQKVAPMEPAPHKRPMNPWLVLALAALVVAISVLIWWLAR